MNSDRVRLKVMGISYSQIQSGAYALILEEVGGPRRIPVVIGPDAAQSIAIKLEGITGQSTNLNFDELLRNRQFVDKLADLMYTYIEKHLSMGKNGEKKYRRYGVV